MGPPELIIASVVLLFFLAIPIVIIVAIWKFVVVGRGDDQRIEELEQRVEELETEER